VERRKEHEAHGAPAIGGEAIFQLGDGGRHDSKLRPRSSSPRLALVIFL
jgi:hypothetical protein